MRLIIIEVVSGSCLWLPSCPGRYDRSTMAGLGEECHSVGNTLAISPAVFLAGSARRLQPGLKEGQRT